MSLEAPPTPAPLVVTDTVASSKLQEEAADTIAALESKSEDTRLCMTLIVTDLDRVNGGAVNEWCLETDVSVSFAKTWSVFSGVDHRCHGRAFTNIPRYPNVYTFQTFVTAHILDILLSLLISYGLVMYIPSYTYERVRFV